nr:MAG TPA: hypothetical protein [Caudoviricetes sp.]
MGNKLARPAHENCRYVNLPHTERQSPSRVQFPVYARDTPITGSHNHLMKGTLT